MKYNLKTELKYAGHQRNKGISKKTGQPYDFASLEVSNGLKSIELEMSPEVDELIKTKNISEGDVINLSWDISKNFGRLTHTVVNIDLVKKAI